MQGEFPPAFYVFWGVIVVARYEHLPIYKKAMDLTIYFEKIVRNFSRYHKYTLGTELREKSREAVGLIIKANSTTVKRPLRRRQMKEKSQRVVVVKSFWHSMPIDYLSLLLIR